MTCKERLQQYLDERQIAYQIQQHPRAFSAQKIAESEHIPGALVAKVVILYADGKPVLATLPATAYLDFDKIASILRAHEVRMASEDELVAMFPDCERGAMPPFGNLYSIPVFADRSLALDEVIVFSAGISTETMSVQYDDFARLVEPTVADLSVAG